MSKAIVFIAGALAGLLGASCFAVEGNYKNVVMRHDRTVFSFRLQHKINNQAGIFVPEYDRTVYVYKTASNSLSSRGGGGSTPRLVPKYDHGTEDREIMIVGYDLSSMADKDVISLKNNQTLYRVGTHTTPGGRTYPCYSRIHKDPLEKYFSRAKTPPPRIIRCPHCRREIRL